MLSPSTDHHTSWIKGPATVDRTGWGTFWVVVRAELQARARDLPQTSTHDEVRADVAIVYCIVSLIVKINQSPFRVMEEGPRRTNQSSSTLPPYMKCTTFAKK